MTDDAQNPYLLYPERGVQKRVRYYDGQFLASADFLLAQSHPIDRHRRHLANTVTAGVLDGYAVHGEADGVVIAPGTAVDAAGRPMVLTQNARRAIQAADRGKNHTLWARYQERADEDSTEDRGASGLTRFDETPEIMYTADGATLPDGVVVLARLQVDAEGNVAVDTSVRPRAGLRIPGPIPLTLTGDDRDPGRGTLAGALKINVPAGTAHDPQHPALDIVGHARARGGLTVGQQSNVGYQGVTNDGNDLVANGQFAAGGSAGSAIYKLGIGMGPPSEGEGTLTAQRLAIGTGATGGKTLKVNGQARFEQHTEFMSTIWAQGEVRAWAGIDTGPNRDQDDGAAGVIAYKRWTDGLDIVGASDGNSANRTITFHAQGGSRHIGDLRVEDDLIVTRDVNPGRHLQAGGDVRAGANAIIAGRTTTERLTINGDARSNALFDGHEVNVRNRATSQHLTVTGGSTLNNLTVNGASALNGNVSVNGGQFNVAPITDFAARVNANGELLKVTNRLMPSVGSDNSKGIVWPGNPGGGSGDVAAIRYYVYGGENTTLQIENGNDADDVITLRQAGENRVVVRNGRVGINEWNPSTDLHVAGGVKVTGGTDIDGTVTAGHIQPSTGWGSTNANCGINWGGVFGGGNDFAGLFYNRVGSSGNKTALVLENENDHNDTVVLRQSSGDRLTVKGGKVGINQTEPAFSLDVGGTARTSANMRIDGDLDLGARDGNREANAGKICYKTHSNDALEIIGGGGPNSSNRRVRVWAENGLVVHGWMHSKGDLRLHDSANNKAMCSHSSSTRAIWGAVKSNGSKWVGEGFTCERYDNHTGVFIIRFNPKFRSRPAVVASRHHPNDSDSSNSWGDTRDNAVVARTSKDWVIVVTGDSSGDRKYRSFEFIAIGPV